MALSNHVTVSGHVSSGRGVATGHLAEAGEALTNLVAGPLYPGTLNVVLDRPLGLEERQAKEFGPGRRIWPARIRGRDVWAYRFRGAPTHVLEIIAHEKLRDSLGLNDGDPIEIPFRQELVAPLAWKSYASWTIFWFGRGDWFCRKDDYLAAVVGVKRSMKRIVSLLRTPFRAPRSLPGQD